MLIPVLRWIQGWRFLRKVEIWSFWCPWVRAISLGFVTWEIQFGSRYLMVDGNRSNGKWHVQCSILDRFTHLGSLLETHPTFLFLDSCWNRWKFLNKTLLQGLIKMLDSFHVACYFRNRKFCRSSGLKSNDAIVLSKRISCK